jgi:hypothetical protein
MFSNADPFRHSREYGSLFSKLLCCFVSTNDEMKFFNLDIRIPRKYRFLRKFFAYAGMTAREALHVF